MRQGKPEMAGALSRLPELEQLCRDDGHPPRGGLVAGSLVLISGDPGIGKSTLLLQASASMADNRRKVVYVTGEETVHQIKLRAERLRLNGEGVFIMAESDLATVLNQVESVAPGLVVIDSIQTVYFPGLE